MNDIEQQEFDEAKQEAIGSTKMVGFMMIALAILVIGLMGYFVTK
jgi:hypothetical protein